MNNYKKTRNLSQKSLLRTLLFFLAIATISIACDDDEGAAPVPDIVEYNNVSISNAQEVPMTGSTAMGTLNASYEKNSNKLDYTITYTGLTPTAMHFHKAEVGVAGPVEQEIPGPYTSGMSGSLTLTDAQEADLLANNWYINIHSAATPAGEIRGQVVTENFVLFTNIALSGKEEVPANSSTTTGTFNGVYDKAMKMMTYKISVNGATPSAMHLHKAGVGVNGDVVVPIPGLTGMTAALTAEQEADLLAGNYYFNLHTAAFPGGEIRGQVVTDNMVIFSNDINDDNEVPATGSSATGSFYGAYNKTTKALSYVVRFTGLTPTAMHFHKGAAGVNGPVVVAINAPYTTGMAASATLTAEQETDMLTGLWYINIHSAAFGAGEIRGQLIK
jgi:CHRD domain